MRRFLTALGFSLILGQAAFAAETCKFEKVAELPIKMEGLRPVIEVKIDGVPANLLVDSGAFFTSITKAKADQAKMRGDPLPMGFQVRGIGGASDFKLGVGKSVELGKAKLKDLQFLIGGPSFGAADGLLGQNVIGQMDVEYDLAQGVMRIFRTTGCKDKALAYWATGTPYSMMELKSGGEKDNHIYSAAKVNGRQIRVLFDTGAPLSTLRRSAAAKSGFSPTAPGVQDAGTVGGIGSEAFEAWYAPFESFAIGQEEIKNTRLIVSDMAVGDADMLLGADFFLSHRILISNAQNKIYFTYNGGPVFRLQARPATRVAVSPAAPADIDKLSDANAYSRRGAAFVARGDVERALSDFTRAIEMEPNEPQHYLDRARAYARGGRPRYAVADADKAISLKPGNTDALLFRAQVQVTGPQPDRAIADLDAVLKANPDDDRLYMQAGDVFMRGGYYDKAIAAYGVWIARHKNDDHVGRLLNARCWARAVANIELDQALTDCNQAMREQSRTADVLDSRGLVRLRRGELKEALADYDQALKLQPRQTWSLYGRGLVKQRMGRGEEAKADLAAARAIDPAIDEQAKRYGLAAAG